MKSLNKMRLALLVILVGFSGSCAEMTSNPTPAPIASAQPIPLSGIQEPVHPVVEVRTIELPIHTVAARLSSNGKYLAVANSSELAIVDTTSAETLVQIEPRSYNMHSFDAGSISWSPDSSKLVVTENILSFFNESDIWVLDLDNKILRDLTDDGLSGGILETGEDSIDWSPVWTDNSTIAFLSTRGGGTSIYEVDLSGSITRVLHISDDSLVSVRLRWLASTERFVFDYNPHDCVPMAECTLYAADRDEQTTKIVLQKSGQPIVPLEPSPQGSDILLVRMLPGDLGQPAVVDLSAAEEAALANSIVRWSGDDVYRGVVLAAFPAVWSPDGTQIAYITEDADIWLSSAQGTDGVELLEGDFEQLAGWYEGVLVALHGGGQTASVIKMPGTGAPQPPEVGSLPIVYKEMVSLENMALSSDKTVAYFEVHWTFLVYPVNPGDVGTWPPFTDCRMRMTSPDGTRITYFQIAGAGELNEPPSLMMWSIGQMVSQIHPAAGTILSLINALYSDIRRLKEENIPVTSIEAQMENAGYFTEVVYIVQLASDVPLEGALTIEASAVHMQGPNMPHEHIVQQDTIAFWQEER